MKLNTLTSRLSIGQKTLIGYLSVSILVALIGFLCLSATGWIVKYFERGEVHFRSVVIAATELSAMVKGAESDLMTYLMLHEPAAREGFSAASENLLRQLSDLDRTVRVPEARKILEETVVKTRDFVSVANTLLRLHDESAKNGAAFDYRTYGPLLRGMNNAAAGVRTSAGRLAKLQTDFLNRQEAITAATEAASHARRAESHLYLYLTLGNAGDREKFLGRLSSLRNQISILEDRVTAPEGVELLGEMRKLTEEVSAAGLSLLDRFAAEDGSTLSFRAGENKALLRKLGDAATRLSENAVALAKLNIQLEALPKERANEQVRNLQLIILSAIVLAFVASLGLGYASVQTISKPLRRLRDAARDIGQGNFDTKVEVHSEDEVGQLAATFNAMAADLKNSRFELTTAKDYLDSIIRSLIDSLVVTTPDGFIYTVNPATCRMLGCHERDLAGQPFLRLLAEDSPLRKAGFGEILRRRMFRSDETYVARDGTRIPVIFSSSVIQHSGGDIAGVVCLAEDITERKLAEDALRKSEELFRLAFEYAPIGIVFAALDGRLLRVNRAFCEIVGYTAEELTARTFGDITYPDDLAANLTMNERLVRGEIPYQRMEKRYIRKSGKIVYAILNVTLVRDPEGQPVHFLAQVIDITARKMAEEEMERSHHRNQLLLEAMGEGMFGIDREGLVTFINPAALEMLGYTQEELIGSPIHPLVHYKKPDGAPYPFESCPMNLAIKQGMKCHVHDEIYWRKDGSSFPVEYVGTPVWEDSDIVGAVVVFVDTTDRRKMEQELMKARKLESVGFLASGIAHDFNNLLTGILSCLTLAKTSGPDRFPQAIGMAEEAAKQAKNLTSQLFTFARIGEPARRMTRAGDLVREAAAVSVAGTGVQCDVALTEDLWPVEIDEAQISRVIHNLVINAVQAMPDGGTVRVGAENALLTDKSGLPLRPGRYVVISVSDSGAGIEPENLQKIFDPYFTTKQRDRQRGTGLGLAICYTIVRNHDGLIVVESKVGEGTTFRIYLPASSEGPVGEE